MPSKKGKISKSSKLPDRSNRLLSLDEEIVFLYQWMIENKILEKRRAAREKNPLISCRKASNDLVEGGRPTKDGGPRMFKRINPVRSYDRGDDWRERRRKSYEDLLLITD